VYVAFIGLRGEKLERAERPRPTLSTVVRPSPWVLGDTGLPKDGKHSPGVKRQYSGTMGKIGHCQIGVSVHAVCAKGTVPLEWALVPIQAVRALRAAATAGAGRGGLR
jgi:hypothetical protein